jgi:hypothetical protein
MAKTKFDINDDEIIRDKSDLKSETNEIHTYFVSDENFERLRRLQQEIYNTLDVSIKIRKLANLLITEENIEKLKQQILTQLKI